MNRLQTWVRDHPLLSGTLTGFLAGMWVSHRYNRHHDLPLWADVGLSVAYVAGFWLAWGVWRYVWRWCTWRRRP
jgi:hypothetical protein